jgi:hypothetical protein
MKGVNKPKMMLDQFMTSDTGQMTGHGEGQKYRVVPRPTPNKKNRLKIIIMINAPRLLCAAAISAQNQTPKINKYNTAPKMV